MNLSPLQKCGLKDTWIRIKSRLYSKDLNKLASLHNCDKWDVHWYTPHYNRHFCHIRKKKLNILEIGVGGYENVACGGDSLRMWKYYFPNSMIYSIDICDKSFFEEDRIKIFKGDQTDEKFLKKVYAETPGLDIIIDDGSHINKDVITSFKILFPLLKVGGIYVVEDTQTSYWPGFGGNSYKFNNSRTTMSFFKNKADCLNYKEFINPEYTPSYYDKRIVSMHFYHNLVFIYKGNNDEESNAIVDNGRKKNI